MHLILVRHPKPLCESGLCYGRLDLECEPQALEAAVWRLATIASATRVVTSPARRACDLAVRLSREAVVDDRLQELNFGDWEGRRWQDLGREPIEAWRIGLPDSAPPKGETLTAMASRCAEWLNSLKLGETPILAVTHAGPIRLIMAILNGEPLLTHFTAAIPFAEPVMIKLPDTMSELTKSEPVAKQSRGKPFHPA